jgi:flagellar basal body-associated protein FliL
MVVVANRLSVSHLIKIKQVAKETSSSSVPTVMIIIVIVIIIVISVYMVAIMLLVKSILSGCYLVYFASIEPDSLTRRAVVDIHFIPSNFLHWC